MSSRAISMSALCSLLDQKILGFCMCSYSTIEPDQYLFLSCRVRGGEEPEEEITVVGTGCQRDRTSIRFTDIEVDVRYSGSVHHEFCKRMLVQQGCEAKNSQAFEWVRLLEVVLVRN